MKLTNESKFFLSIIASTILVIIIAVVLLSQPTKPMEKTSLIGPNTHTKGNNDAKVWLVEFSDFECPACRVFNDTVKTLLDQNPDTLLFAHRHFPLMQHAFSKKSAIAAEAAGRQNKFWEMAHGLYKESTLSDASIATLAKTLELNEVQFASDSADPALEKVITDDMLFGESIGINATPTFFLNGVKLDLQSPEDLKQKVEEAIKKS